MDFPYFPRFVGIFYREKIDQNAFCFPKLMEWHKHLPFASKKMCVLAPVYVGRAGL